jgi:hypothetical protein
MKRIARATTAIVGAVVMTPMVVNAEPMLLTAKEMDSITAAAQQPEINVNVAVITQIANATALSFAICGVCTDGGPKASSFAAATNFGASAQGPQ